MSPESIDSISSFSLFFDDAFEENFSNLNTSVTSSGLYIGLGGANDIIGPSTGISSMGSNFITGSSIGSNFMTGSEVTNGFY